MRIPFGLSTFEDKICLKALEENERRGIRKKLVFFYQKSIHLRIFHKYNNVIPCNLSQNPMWKVIKSEKSAQYK